MKMAEEKATIIDAEGPQILEEGPSLPDILTESFVEAFEKGIMQYKKWVAACYRLTRESHWINHGTADKPKFSLQAPGAEALMNPLGISCADNGKPTYTVREAKLDGGGYAYWCEGYMESKTLKRSGYYVGYCDSRDPFFNARPGWKPETGHADIHKASMANWEVRGVTMLGGLRDPDPQLLRAAGLDPGKIQTIDYRGGKTPEESAGVISEPQRKRLWAIAKNAQISEDDLRPYLKKWYGLDSMKDIKRKDYDKICEQVESAYLPMDDKDKKEEKEPGTDG